MLILTDRRVILYKKGMIRRSTTDFARDEITNVSFDKGVFRRKLTISGSAFKKNGPSHTRVAKSLLLRYVRPMTILYMPQVANPFKELLNPRQRRRRIRAYQLLNS